MRLKHLATATLIALASSVATAAGLAPTALPREADLRAYLPAPLSRAEVLADLEVYRRSGLAELDHQDSPDSFSSAYASARARYLALRAAPEFGQLVARIARERGEAVATASSASAPMAR